MAPAYRRLNPATPYERASSTLRSLPRLAYVAAGVVTFLATAGLYAYSCKDGHCAAARWWDHRTAGDATDGTSFNAGQLKALGFTLSDEAAAQRPEWTAIRDTWEAEQGLQALESPPSPYPFTAAILYLLSVSRILQASASIESLARYLPMTQPYPILLLHEGDFDSPDMQAAFFERWSARTADVRTAGEADIADKMDVFALLIEFVPVDLKPPAEMAVLGKEGLDPVFDWAWPGYHSMCRFFATGIFDHPRIRNFDYYMRMDSDSYTHSSMAVDPFVTMHTRNKTYGFRNRGTDPEFVTVGMWDFVRKYAKDHPAVAELARENGLEEEKYGDRFPMMNNNFEVVHIPSFKTPEVADWLLHVRAQTKGFYKYRWGDAPLRAATVAMFFREDQLIELCDFSYFHQSDVAKSCDLPPLE